MLTMQNNDPRLIKAAKRTIRAEVTLVVVILIITSWSAYALYKLTLDGSGTIFGINLSKSNPPKSSSSSSSSASNSTGAPSDLRRSTGNQGAESIQYEHQQHFKSAPTTKEVYNLPLNNNSEHKILREHLEKLREYNDQLSQIRAPSFRPIPQEQQRPFPTETVSSFDKRGLPSNELAGLLEDLRQQRLIDTGLRPQIRLSRGDYKGSSPSSIQPSIQETSDNDSLNEQQGESNSTSVTLGAHNNISSPIDDDNDANQESPDKAAASDRQAAASNRYASESVADTTTDAPADVGGDDAAEETSAAQEEDGQDDSQDQSMDSQETPAQRSSDDNGNGGDNIGSSDDEEPTSEQANDEESSHDRNDTSQRDEGHAVDEAVDRMTQPSNVGVLAHSEEDNSMPFDYKNTVQFDDSASGVVLGGVTSPSNRQVSMNSAAPGDTIARFAAPQEKSVKRKANKNPAAIKESDLQVDHNRPIVLSGSTIVATEAATENATVSRTPMITKPDAARAPQVISNKKIKPGVIIGKRNQTSRIQETEDRSKNDNLLTSRQKRSDKIKAPYEVDDYLNSLNFDILVGQSTTSRALNSRRYPRSANSIESSGKPNELTVYSSLAPTEYQYLTTNDTNLQQLFSHKELLDALKKSQLPTPNAPQTGPNKNKATVNQPATLHIDKDVPGNRQQKAALSEVEEVAEVEPAAANSLTDVNDRGVEGQSSAISAAASGDNHHKSMSMKKKKKHEKKEHKKKMSAGSKKGGHKKKKHKKEMKKYVKEKKFKGAKKGKKEAKGKGGQGGKKGKKLYKDKGFKKRGFKNVYHKEEFGQKKSYFDEFRDKDFKKKWKKFDDKYNYAQMKKWQAKDVKGAKKVKDHEEKYKKYDKSQWKKKYEKKMKEQKASSKKKKKSHKFRK